MCTNYEIRARKRRAWKDESGLVVLKKVAPRKRLVPLAGVFDPARTRQTPALKARGRQLIQTFTIGSDQDGFVTRAVDDVRAAIGQQERDGILLVGQAGFEVSRFEISRLPV
jgi:hypothetical protein